MRVQVRVAPLLHNYTGGKHVVEAEGATVGELLDDLDRRHPGVAFRILDEQGRVRKHMRVYVGEDAAADRNTPVPSGAEMYIVGALSGG